MDDIEYFEIEGVKGRYFACTRLRATLSVATCISRHKAASDGETNISCHRCPVGAAHCGKKLEAPSLLSSKICARCLKQSTRIVHGRLCVSCYNRTREVHRGSNAKGGMPALAEKLYTGLVGVRRADGGWHLVRVESVREFVEVLVSAARQERGAVFSWASSIRERLCASGLRRRQPCK